jgi:hypothetical protein
LGENILWRIITGNSSWSKRALWKKYFQGPRKKCLNNPAKVEKGSPIFSLCQKALRHFKPHLTWTPGNGKEIKVWEDSMMGDPPLDSKKILHRLKEWMRLKNLHNMWDISRLENDESHSWLRWEIANLPPELEEEWNMMKYWLQGKTP